MNQIRNKIKSWVPYIPNIFIQPIQKVLNPLNKRIDHLPLVHKIINSPLFQEKPPVLIDIGASMSLHQKWKAIAPYSICIAFDADDRNMSYIKKENKNYKKLYVFNSIVSDKEDKKADFHLTSFAPSSSTLEPKLEVFNDWLFAGNFSFKKVYLKNISLNNALQKLGIDYVDWFKADSQGTDLRLFKNMGEKIYKKCLCAEFEAGIVEFYKNEDKLHQVLEYMENQPFFLSKLELEGRKTIINNVEKKYFHSGKNLNYWCKNNLRWFPFQASTLYINNFSNKSFGERDLLLGCVISLLERHTGFTIELANIGKERFHNKLFSEIENYCVKTIQEQLKISKINI